MFNTPAIKVQTYTRMCPKLINYLSRSRSLRLSAYDENTSFILDAQINAASAAFGRIRICKNKGITER